jgi:hypothetical protein
VRDSAWTEGSLALELRREELELEARSDHLLRRHGAFRRGSLLRSSRSERRQGRRSAPWEVADGQAAAALRGDDLWPYLEALAEAARLRREERAVLGLCKLDGCSLEEAGRVVGLSTEAARQALRRALGKCEPFRVDLPLPAEALFWLEVRQKQALIYRR